MNFSIKLKQRLNNKKVFIFVRLLIGFAFFISAILKIIDPIEFGRVIYSYSIVPNSWVAILSLVIPYLELFLGLMLLLDLFSGTASLIGLVMVLCFTVISMYRYINGDVTDCGCFGNFIKRENDLTLLVENLVFITALYFIIHIKYRIKFFTYLNQSLS
jgi:uncharacterized membrane protein YphA (DoxX/SURF4 family)